jgi:hypothetical protein
MTRASCVLLVRVGADLSEGGGAWNGPVDSETGRFVYCPIPETRPCRPGLATPYSRIADALSSMGAQLPSRLAAANMHLDPDFEHLTYGDRGNKGAQLARLLAPDDIIAFYSGLRCIRSGELVYGLIGVLVVDSVQRAIEAPDGSLHENAHTRREMAADADDVIVRGRRGKSGRLDRSIPIGEYRDRAYRVRPDVLASWGGISSSDGFIQRSGAFPRILDPHGFERWLAARSPTLRASNWDV